ncbi:WHG domain-containing protein [Actinosynnema sp. CA-248983]
MVNTRRAKYREETKEEAKRIALEQLAELGLEGISVNAIAKRMGVTGPALYRYFKNRDELLNDLVRDAWSDLADQVETAVARAAGRPHRERVHGFAGAFRAWALSQPHRYLLLFGTPLPGYQAPEDTIALAHRTMSAFLGVLAEGAADHGPVDRSWQAADRTSSDRPRRAADSEPIDRSWQAADRAAVDPAQKSADPDSGDPSQQAANPDPGDPSQQSADRGPGGPSRQSAADCGPGDPSRQQAADRGPGGPSRQSADVGFAEQLQAWARSRGESGLHHAVLLTGLRAFTRLHGVLSLEVAGQFGPMGFDPALLYRAEVESLLSDRLSD